MRLTKLSKGCTIQSYDPLYLFEVCRRFGGTYCPLFKADDWQSKRRRQVLRKRLYLYVVTSQRMVFSIVYIIPGSYFVAVVYCYWPPEECYALVYYIQCNLMFLWPCIMNWPYKTTNVMHWILFIRQILLLSSTCFEYQVQLCPPEDEYLILETCRGE